MPAHPYASYANFTTVYSVAGLSQSALENHYLPAGSRWLDSRLSRAFTVPFSSNNLTVRDMNIYSAMLLFYEGRTSKQDDANELRRMLDGWVDTLVNGNGTMSLSGDTVLASDGALHDVWSTNQSYTPTFSMLPAEEEVVDADRLDDELDARD